MLNLYRSSLIPLGNRTLSMMFIRNYANYMHIFDTKIAIKLKVMELFQKFQLFCVILVLYMHCMVFS